MSGSIENKICTHHIPPHYFNGECSWCLQDERKALLAEVKGLREENETLQAKVNALLSRNDKACLGAGCRLFCDEEAGEG